MTDEHADPPEDERERSNGDVEIEITRGSIDDRRADSERPGTDGSHDDNTRRGRRGARDDGEPRERVGTRDGEGELADELGRIDVMTTPEGYVEGRITDVTAFDATTVELVVALPHGETATFTLEKPIPWSREFLLARVVEDVGYDAASIDYIVGEPVYLQRTDLEDRDDEDWWSESVQSATDALVSSLSGGRYRFERDDDPEWRLVDPLERPDTTTEAADESIGDLVGAGLVVLGSVLAAAGAVLGATGGLVVSVSVLGYASLGVLLVLAGLVVLFRTKFD